MSRKYAIGVDYGTESGRALLVDVATGEEIATAVYEYADGVIDEALPGTGVKLPPDFALQNPADYIETLRVTIPAVLREAGVSAADVIGIGTDFTACTMLPIDKQGTPLCLLPEWRENPYAWVKLWKHHAAQPEANRLNEIARQRGEDFLSRYGGKISSEWLVPKIWETLNKAPEVYAAADRFIEAADWIVLQLCGQERRNSCTAGYKGIWEKATGYPSDDFYAALDPRLRRVVDEKLSRRIYPLGGRAGRLTKAMAQLTGLREGTAVAIGNVDAHVSVPAATVVEPGRMVMIMGTSTCHMVLGAEKRIVEGMCGVVEDGIIPGYFGYEAGQSGVGDIFAWFVDHGVPPEYHDEAKQRGISLHQVLEEKAAQLKPGESGLLALDWWNGNRSILVDVDLTGLLVGATLATKAEEIYRALIEATAFGTRLIMETFQSSGVPVREVVACGGLPERNKLLMQIYVDVTGREFKIARSKLAGALGAAMFGAVAAGQAAGGYDSILDAAKRMAHLKDEVYRPIPEHQRAYDQLYAEYVKLHDTFGRVNPVMKKLKRIRAEALGLEGAA
ncbi:MAG: ribulokinase [Chloroflexi bacterium]|mgnify:CR=1 FL=1|nr:ribulokinase [Chloroflexota bacterium]